MNTNVSLEKHCVYVSICSCFCLLQVCGLHSNEQLILYIAGLAGARAALWSSFSRPYVDDGVSAMSDEDEQVDSDTEEEDGARDLQDHWFMFLVSCRWWFVLKYVAWLVPFIVGIAGARAALWSSFSRPYVDDGMSAMSDEDEEDDESEEDDEDDSAAVRD